MLIWLIPLIISIERLRHCHLGLSICITVVYSLDIVIYLLTAPVDEKTPKNTEAAAIAKSAASLGAATVDTSKGVGIHSLLRSKQRYLRRWLFLELITTIPFDIILKSPLPAHFDIFLLIRLARVLQLRRLIKNSPLWLKSWQMISSALGVGNSFMTMFVLAGLLCCFIHLEACAVWFGHRLTGKLYANWWYGNERIINTIGEQYSLAVAIAVGNLFQLGYR